MGFNPYPKSSDDAAAQRQGYKITTLAAQCLGLFGDGWVYTVLFNLHPHLRSDYAAVQERLEQVLEEGLPAHALGEQSIEEKARTLQDDKPQLAELWKNVRGSLEHVSTKSRPGMFLFYTRLCDEYGLPNKYLTLEKKAKAATGAALAP